jgi:guanine nucleotide-binding protein alpha-1 subunit
VNRLEDSYQLWRLICSSKLLVKAQIILFLNKCDLRTYISHTVSSLARVFFSQALSAVDKKLKSGVRVKDYVPSFGDRKNELQTVAQCEFRAQFLSSAIALLLTIFFYVACEDFAQHFKEIARQSMSGAKTFRVHLTSVVVRSFHRVRSKYLEILF